MADDVFGYETELRVRTRDLDHMLHVNNAVYATYMEQARIDYFTDVLGVGLDRLEIAVVSNHIDFEQQLRYGGWVTVQIRVAELGRTSFCFEYRFLDGDDVTATARTVQVALDKANDTSRPIPDVWREKIVDHEGIPREYSTGDER